jgi:hypothetical protein
MDPIVIVALTVDIYITFEVRLDPVDCYINIDIMK